MIRTGNVIPDFLEPSSFEYVRGAMVQRNDELPSAAVALPKDLVIDPLSGLFINTENDTSFTRQMHQLVNNPTTLHPDITYPPDGFVFTANSAIPVANAVRGYYEAKGQEPPTMTHIAMNRRSSSGIYQRFGKGEGGVFEPLIDEIKRLHAVLGEKEHVTVVDQYVDSGITLKCAALLLYGARVGQVSGVVGRWYDQINKDKVDIEGLDVWDEKIYDLMHKIGTAAYEIAK